MAWSPKFTFSVTWDNVSSKPATATRWPTWDEVTDKPPIGGAVWGGITGTLADQTDLQAALDSKASDSEVVKVNGLQQVYGEKRFRDLCVSPPVGGSSPELSLLDSGGNRVGVVGVRTDGAFYMSDAPPGISPTWLWFNSTSATFVRDVNVGRDVVTERNVVSGGDVTATGSVSCSGITSPSLTGTGSITTISAGSTSGVIRFRPRGSSQLTGQMELHNSGTLTSRNGYYYSYSGEIRLGSASNYIYMNSNGAVFTPGRVSAEVDNTYPCGGSGYRWTVVYATTGSINTSDAREKQDFRELSEQELQCGLQLARDAQIYRWKHAVEEKGEGARLHCSPTVQQVIATMESFGLDPFRYGFVCYDEWDAEPDEVDEEGQVTKKGSPAGDRYSLRPDELRAFVDAAIVARQDLIEARLEALETHE